MQKQSNTNSTFSGVLMPYQNKSSKGEAPILCLIGSSDEELLVKDKTTSGALSEYVYERVLIAGTVSLQNGRKILSAKRFEPLPEPDYDNLGWDQEEY